MEINQEFINKNLTDCGGLTKKQIQLVGATWPVENPDTLLNELLGRNINDFEASLFSTFRTHKTTDREVFKMPKSTAIKPTELDKTGEGKKVNNAAEVVQINADKLKQVDDQKIVTACEEMKKIEASRKELNDKANEIRASLNDIGIPTAAFNAAFARYKKSESARAKQDAAYMKCCNAMNVGYQSELFSL